MSAKFISYWLGYCPTGVAPDFRPPLDAAPSFVDIVNLAFAVPDVGSTVNTDFLISKNTKESILAGARVLQARGQKVTLSINGNDKVPWDSLDPKTFAANIQKVCADWKLDGVDLDNETPGTTPGAVFVDCIKAIRDLMGPDFLITYPAYVTFRDGFLPQVADILDMVCTMAYWNDYGPAVGLYTAYANMVGPEKVCIGVKCGKGFGDQSTPYQAVAPLAQYEPPGAKKGGMMFWNLNSDVESITGKPLFTWTNDIQTNLVR